MPDHAYCDVSLPVPLDQEFTYSVPTALRPRVQAGCRVLVPLGRRSITGVVTRVHGQPPDATVRDLQKLLDEEPVLDQELLSLGRWIAQYYCCPYGEVLRSMTPVTAEVKRSRSYQLTDQGRALSRQAMLLDDATDETTRLLQALETRALSQNYLTKKFPNAPRLLKSLVAKGLVAVEEEAEQRDPARAPADRLMVAFLARPGEGVKLRKPERELLSYLELHPGAHLLSDLIEILKNASESARALYRRQLVTLEMPTPTASAVASGAPHRLNAHQQAAADAIGAALAAGEFHAFLLQGVTGSGKTEVYLTSIDACLAQGRSALLLVPEIALTPQVAGQFVQRFGDRVAILHSAFSDLERVEQWRRIRQGKANVIVGTRSAVFAPVKDLGLIIVDEEHDGSYKQGEAPRYHGRDVAVMRAHAARAAIVMGSATPSLETRYNAERGKYTRLELPERIQQRPMPEVELVDMRQEFLDTRRADTFSRRMLEAIAQRLEKKEQVVVLHNRRGFSSFVACRACGKRMECVNCSVTLTYHKRDRRLLCHYCNHSTRAPEQCPQCQSDYIQFLGTGSEKVEEELHRHFPQARIARLDRDTVSSKRHFEDVLHGFRAGDYDLLVGTQMIAKGHDIHNVTLVCVVNADLGLGVNDFRAAERTFQLLTQVAGRAGRGDLPGQVLLQTIAPDHYAIRMASAQDYETFYAKEMEFRRAMRYPPFASMANVMVRAEQEQDAFTMAGQLAHWLGPNPPQMKLLGPAPAPVTRLKNEFRFQIVLKSPQRKVLNDALRGLQQFAREQKWAATALVVDVDPLSLL